MATPVYANVIVPLKVPFRVITIFGIADNGVPILYI